MRQKFKFDAKTGTMVPEAVQREEPAGVVEIPKPDKESASMIADERVESNVAVNEDIVQFRERSDLTIFQIMDEQTGAVLGYISGYALDINFNMGELRSTERVEQFLDGIKKMFREAILEKAFSSKK